MDSTHPEHRTIHTTILINAPIAKVRDILFDFPSYPTWSKFIGSIEHVDASAAEAKPNALTLEEKLKVVLQPPEGSPMTMTPTVTHVEENGFAWTGALPLGLFGGQHFFVLTPEEGGAKTLLTQREQFNGLLFTPLMDWLGMRAKSIRGFEIFNESLKEKAEKEQAKL